MILNMVYLGMYLEAKKEHKMLLREFVLEMYMLMVLVLIFLLLLVDINNLEMVENGAIMVLKNF